MAAATDTAMYAPTVSTGAFVSGTAEPPARVLGTARIVVHVVRALRK